jgi:hypothetical protein
MNLNLSSLGRGKMWDLKISQPYWPRVSHVSRWIKVEVRYFRQYQRVFRLSFFQWGGSFVERVKTWQTPSLPPRSL